MTVKDASLLYLVLAASLITVGHASAQDGKALFQSNCAQCHNPIKVVTGPALKGVTERVTDRKLLHNWIHNNVQVLATGNVYFNNLYAQYAKSPMSTFPFLTDPEIDAILKYVDNYAQPLTASNDSLYPDASLDDHTVLYAVVTAILAIFAFGMYLLTQNLKKLAEEKKGIAPPPHIPFYRRKTYIALFSLVGFFALGVWLVQLGVGLGRSKGYQPEQPIFFSHHVHAGLNQISCLLCHGSAWDGKSATVPALNVCMNCHATITEYKGGRLEREDGSRVVPDDELKKLFLFAGYDPVKGKYTRPGKAVEWIRIHNLPDHVFFSHAQHIRAGKIQCQTCHGPVQDMNEVRQFAELSMGWCINCHRTTRVDFPDSAANPKGNKFYGIYATFSRDLRSGKKDSVTVEDIGGTECQKCHY